MKIFNAEYVTLTFHQMTSYRKINIACQKIISYRVISTTNHHCCQINIIVRERPRILFIIRFSLFLRHQNKIFKLIKPVYTFSSFLKNFFKYAKTMRTCVLSDIFEQAPASYSRHTLDINLKSHQLVIRMFINIRPIYEVFCKPTVC